MKARLTLGVMAATLALGAVQAQANNDARRGGFPLPEFGELDANQSGSFTRDDLTAFLQNRGTWQDRIVARLMEQADADGKLDEARLRAGLQAMADARAPRGGNRMDPERMGARMFDRIDANDDGVVDADEYAAFRDHAAERMGRRGPHGRN